MYVRETQRMQRDSSVVVNYLNINIMILKH